MKPKGFIRKTKQRQVILKVLRGTKTHPTADWVYQEVRKEIPHISLGTVYRNIKTLSEHGEIQELSFGSTHSHFDANSENHYHFICQKCGAIQDLDLRPMVSLEKEVEEETGNEVYTHRLEFYGICSACAGEDSKTTNS